MNTAKINKLIQTLQTYPEFYDQEVYGYRKNLMTGHQEGPESASECGTRACLAGYAVMMEGYSLLFDAEDHSTERCHQGENKYDIFELARKILGLNAKDAGILFDADSYEWRHEQEFLDAAETRKADVAVAELEDLVRLGSYTKKKKIQKKSPALVEIPAASQEKVLTAQAVARPEPQQQTAKPAPAEIRPRRRHYVEDGLYSVCQHSERRRAFQQRGIRLRFRAQMRKAWQMK